MLREPHAPTPRVAPLKKGIGVGCSTEMESWPPQLILETGRQGEATACRAEWLGGEGGGGLEGWQAEL